MSVVKIKDKTFKTSIPEKEIKARIQAVADRINHDLADKNPLFLAVLNGAFVFAADLMRMITIPCESLLSGYHFYREDHRGDGHQRGSYRSYHRNR